MKKKDLLLLADKLEIRAKAANKAKKAPGQTPETLVVMSVNYLIIHDLAVSLREVAEQMEE